MLTPTQGVRTWGTWTSSSKCPSSPLFFGAVLGSAATQRQKWRPRGSEGVRGEAGVVPLGGFGVGVPQEAANLLDLCSFSE